MLVLRVTSGTITLAHGAGALETWRLVRELIVNKIPDRLRRAMDGYGLDVLDDAAALKIGENLYLVVTVDTYTVSPYRFPGGDIGSLTANGVINDLVVSGAKPLAFMDTVVVEEGFPESELRGIIDSLIGSLMSEGVALIGGDFKVMPKGSLDKVLITGVGLGLTERPIPDNELRVGDKIIVTGDVAEHGATILAAQLGLLSKASGLRSDTRPLSRTLLKVVREFRNHIHAARDPTRGGLAAVLSEWASANNLAIMLHRGKVPIREEVRAFLEAMGVDHLSMASEGIAVLAVEGSVVEEVLAMLRDVGERRAEVVGEVIEPPTKFLTGRVIGVTEVGGKVLIEPKSLNLPRIC
ncbi:MAG: hydrogenase expression/formation protein HypE [Zestosphaera sp.]